MYLTGKVQLDRFDADILRTGGHSQSLQKGVVGLRILKHKPKRNNTNRWTVMAFGGAEQRAVFLEEEKKLRTVWRSSHANVRGRSTLVMASFLMKSDILDLFLDMRANNLF